MRSRILPCLCIPAFCLSLLVVSSGCASRSLKEANRRLKEANDHLISENNRLESELEEYRSRLARGEPALPQEYPDPSRAKVATELIVPPDLQNIPGTDITQSPTGIHVRVNDRVFFALGQAKLSKNGQRVLDKIGRILNNEYRDHMIRVDGHTDDMPIRKVRHIYPTNWELSTARACTVVRYLVDRGNVNVRRIYPAGFSYFRPIETGKTASARSRNRRVEITILNETI